MINESQYKALIKQLNQHNYEYYTLNQSSISDAEFDQHYQQLKEFETNHPLLIHPNSPTQRVGSEPETGFKQHTHQTPLLSLSMHLTNKILPTF